MKTILTKTINQHLSILFNSIDYPYEHIIWDIQSEMKDENTIMVTFFITIKATQVGSINSIKDKIIYFLTDKTKKEIEIKTVESSWNENYNKKIFSFTNSDIYKV